MPIETNQNISLQVLGNYHMQIRFTMLAGGSDIVITPSSIREFVISQSLYSMLPEMKIVIPSGGEFFTHVVPLDTMLRLRVDFGVGEEPYKNWNGFDFLIFRRFPKERDSLLIMEGYLDIDNVNNQEHIRGFSGPVKESVESVIGEMKIGTGYSTAGKIVPRISPSLQYSKNLVQPLMTNMDFLIFLSENLEGANNQGPFYCYFYNQSGTTYFSFQTLEEMVEGPIRYRFAYPTAVVAEENNQNTDYYRQVWNYEIEDNYRMAGLRGAKSLSYYYYDYSGGMLKKNQVDYTGFLSLTKKFSILKSDADKSLNFPTGRSNDFTADFTGNALHRFYRRLINLERMKITTYGIPNIVPGDLVNIVFTKLSAMEHNPDYQYQGTWMVEKVLHCFGSDYINHIVLIRNGIDSSLSEQFLEPVREKT